MGGENGGHEYRAANVPEPDGHGRGRDPAHASACRRHPSGRGGTPSCTERRIRLHAAIINWTITEVTPADILGAAETIDPRDVATCSWVGERWVRPDVYLEWAERGLQAGDAYGWSTCLHFAKLAATRLIDGFVQANHLRPWARAPYPEKMNSLKSNSASTSRRSSTTSSSTPGTAWSTTTRSSRNARRVTDLSWPRCSGAPRERSTTATASWRSTPPSSAGVPRRPRGGRCGCTTSPTGTWSSSTCSRRRHRRRSLTREPRRSARAARVVHARGGPVPGEVPPPPMGTRSKP